MLLSEFCEQTAGRLINGDCRFTSISTDTRHLRRGDLFVALRGEHFDGNEFAEVAASNGAIGLVVHKALENITVPQLIVADTVKALGIIAARHRESFRGRIVGLTGSCGKTTVKGMLREILSVEGSTLATQGNLNNHIGVPLTLMKLGLQAYGVIEMGTSSPGEIAWLTELVQPQVALVNNIAPAHIGGFRDLDAIAAEKGEIYKQLSASGTAVINLDDEYASYFQRICDNARQLGFSRRTDVAGYPHEIVLSTEERLNQRQQAEFLLHLGGRHTAVKLQVLGLYNISNALAAAACALALGCSLDSVVQGLSNYSGEKGRMQVKTAGCGATVIDDTYNANPVAMKAAIDVLGAFGGDTFLVIGNMAELGELSGQAHAIIGAYAAEKKITSVYSWGGEAAVTARAFGREGYAYTDKKELVAALLPRLHKNATVLAKGSRSTRMEEVVAMLCEEGTSKC